ncbi:hypothetical protein ACFX1R_042437 [Malus domestica]
MKPTWLFVMAMVNPTIYKMTISPSKHSLLKNMRGLYLKRLSGSHGEDWYHIVTTPSISIDLIFARECRGLAWSYKDIPGISPDVICYCLSIDSKTKPVRQKRISYDIE